MNWARWFALGTGPGEYRTNGKLCTTETYCWNLESLDFPVSLSILPDTNSIHLKRIDVERREKREEEEESQC